MKIRKETLRGRIRSAVGCSNRKAGEVPRTGHYSVVLRVDATDRNGDTADVRLELSAGQVRDLILRQFPSSAVADLLSERDKARVRGTFETEFPNG